MESAFYASLGNVFLLALFLIVPLAIFGAIGAWKMRKENRIVNSIRNHQSDRGFEVAEKK